MNKYEQEFEDYYNKYGERCWVYAGTPVYNKAVNGLLWTTYLVVEKRAGVPEMAYAYGVDEQQLYDNVKCQRSHNRWMDSL